VVSPNQESASAIPGNIGIARAKVLVWDHDPLYGRPHQQTEYPFSANTRLQLDEQTKASPNAEFETGSVFLKPQYEVHNTWMASLKWNGQRDAAAEAPQQTTQTGGARRYDLDFLEPNGAQKEHYPNSDENSAYVRNGKEPDENGKVDDTTGRDIFAHQIWMHRGSLLKKGVPLHPSEYDINLAAVGNAKELAKLITDAEGRLARSPDDVFDKYTMSELYAAPKWSYELVTDNGRAVFWPAMVNTPSPDGLYTTHWTIEKLTPIWQGQDFFVTIALGEQETADAVDPGPESVNPDVVDTNWHEYKYLMFKKPEKNPPTGFATSVGQDADVNNKWIDGISNEAFYVAPRKSGSTSGVTNDDKVEAEKASRALYWWKYKTYVLIEMGVHNTDHNYFIELVKGRNPRLLHLGYEWDNPKRLTDEVALADDWAWLPKCRVISEYAGIVCDELFRKKDFRVKIRNHIGRLVIKFDGFDADPWVITRFDNDPTTFNYTKVPVPMVVPAAKLRIHGGNISCAIGYAPTRYPDSAAMTFPDRQADSYESDDDDLWMTFATIGMPLRERNEAVRKIFDDARFGIRTMGYRCDANTTYEVHKNKIEKVKVYRTFFERYRKYGKGFILPRNIPDPQKAARFRLDDGSDKNSFSPPLSGVKPHVARISNADKSNRRRKIFDLTVENDDYYKDRIKDPDKVGIWNVQISLEAGTVGMHKFNGGYIRGAGATGAAGQINDFQVGSKDKLFVNFITPIIPQWNMIMLGGAKPMEGRVDPIDITNLVTHMQDSWTSEGFNSINHTMKLRCYIPDSFLPISAEPGPGQIDEELHGIGQQLLTLHKQGFYITVAYWWDNGVGERDAPGNKLSRRQAPEDDHELLIQMTGIAKGATLEKSVNKLFMEFEVNDYSKILEDQLIWNSPFFDGVADVEAVYELARMASFDDSYDQQASINRQPLGFLTKVLTDRYVRETTKILYNGEESRFRPYDLPGTYADFQNAKMRFQNGETYWSAIKKMAQLSSKVAYFDRWGVLRYENSPAVEAAFAGKDFDNGDFQPKFQFVTSPFPVSSAGGDPGSTAARRFVFDPNRHAAHLVYNVVTYTRSVQDACSQIILYTASNELLLDDGTTVGGFIIKGHTFFDQIFDPTAEGFLGYRKPWYQSNGVFGSVEAVRNAIQHYAQTRYPPAIIQFETYGVPGLKPLDIITLDDNLFFISEISHEIDPSTNLWWMNITAQWLKPHLGDIGIISPRGTTDSGAGGSSSQRS
jgi:hypothetical protein